MNDYLPLLQLQVEHGFYADGLCRGLSFAPSPDARRQMDQAGCVWKDRGSGLVVLAERRGLQRYLAASNAPLCLGFVATVRDSGFAEVTAGAGTSMDVAPLFSMALPQESGEVAAPCIDASAADLQWLDSARWAALGLGRMRPAGLAFGVQFEWPAMPAQVFDGEPGHEWANAFSGQCRIRFAARALPWVYHLVGDWPRDELFLADVDGALQFSDFSAQRLADGRRVHSACSTAAIALAERARQRIQLRRRTQGRERVLVKCLPVAAPGTWGLLPDGGGLVAEIYVNR